MDYRNYDRGYAEPTMSASDYMTRTYAFLNTLCLKRSIPGFMRL